MFLLSVILCSHYLLVEFLIPTEHNNNKKVTNLAAQKNHVEPGVLLNYWRKRISTCLQVGNANIISDAFIYLFDQGGGNLTIDYSVESTL